MYEAECDVPNHFPSSPGRETILDTKALLFKKYIFMSKQSLSGEDL